MALDSQARSAIWFWIVMVMVFMIGVAGIFSAVVYIQFRTYF